jgi:hypothetical protein
VVATLRDAYADGRLTLEEFQERTAAAYGGRTWGDLRGLTTDLPVQPVLGADLPPEAQPAGVASAQLPPGSQPGALPPGFPWAYPPAGMSIGQQGPGQQVPGVPPYSGPQAPEPRSPHPRTRPFAPVIPVVGIWILFALATRSAGGAIAFIIAVALLVTLASVGRRPPRGPSDHRRD